MHDPSFLPSSRPFTWSTFAAWYLLPTKTPAPMSAAAKGGKKKGRQEGRAKERKDKNGRE
jgi:hypothetical protein